MRSKTATKTRTKKFLMKENEREKHKIYFEC